MGSLEGPSMTILPEFVRNVLEDLDQHFVEVLVRRSLHDLSCTGPYGKIL